MTQQSDLQALVMAVGEIRGQMRELVHATNNNSQIMTSMGASVSKLETLPADIAELKSGVAALEAAENRRVGAVGLGGWVLRSPVFGWLFGALSIAWLTLRGKAGQ